MNSSHITEKELKACIAFCRKKAAQHQKDKEHLYKLCARWKVEEYIRMRDNPWTDAIYIFLEGFASIKLEKSMVEIIQSGLTAGIDRIDREDFVKLLTRAKEVAYNSKNNQQEEK